MIALVLWGAASALAGLVIGRAIRAGAVDQSPACTQNCRQGRDCTCRAPTVEPQP